MKNIKLKNTVACGLALYLPVIVAIALGIGVLVIFGESVGAIAIVVSIIVALIYLVKNFVNIMTISLLVDQISNWQKTRLWYSVGDDTPQEIESRITASCKGFGVERQVRNTCPELVSVRYKRNHSWNYDVAANEKVVLLYRASELDDDNYNSIMRSAKSAVKELKCKVSDLKFLEKEQKKSPVLTAAAVIILADRIDFNLPEKIRKAQNFNDTAVIPCVIELSSKRCWFDGLKEVSLGGSTPVKNRTIKLITKIVFNGKLPLKNNEDFDYSTIDRQTLEMTIGDIKKGNEKNR